jgi:hypothetical protein
MDHTHVTVDHKCSTINNVIMYIYVHYVHVTAFRSHFFLVTDDVLLISNERHCGAYLVISGRFVS